MSHVFRTTTAALLIAICASVPASAKATPKVLQASTIAAKRISNGGKMYYSLSAVVKLDRTLTSAERKSGGLGLVASTWSTRQRLDSGATLPDALFGGTSPGRVGKTSSHCYVAEVAQLAAHRTAKPGQSWRIALHNGRRVLSDAPRVVLAKSTEVSETDQLKALRC